MKKCLLLLAVILQLFSCNTVTERPKTPEELRLELMSQEQNQPTYYLEVDSKMREDQVLVKKAGLFRDAEYSPDGNTIFGTIANKATVAKFKDIVLEVTYFSQTDTPIETQEYTIYEYFEPQHSKEFQIKVYPPEAMKKFGLEVKSATPVY